MPIYEYRCNDCGKQFETRQKFSDDPLTECIHCQGLVEKLISQSAFVLKGSGWYKTDYASKDKCATPPKNENKTASGCDSCPVAGSKGD